MIYTITITIILTLLAVALFPRYPYGRYEPYIPAKPKFYPPPPKKRTNIKPTTMTLNEYQRAAMKTCMPSCDNFSYMFLNLVGEVGELASKVAKQIRKGKGFISSNKLYLNIDNTDYNDIRKEAGDILWQLSGLCEVMGWSLEDVASENLKKLADRQTRNVIDGNGDNR